MQENGPIILFDGVCNLCNATVQTIIRLDRTAQFRFCALQSDAGQSLLEQAGYQGPALDSVVLYQHQQVWTHSDAVLEIARRLGGPMKIVLLLKIIPQKTRDRLYLWIARNRYTWFGRRPTCMIPTPGLKSRFL